MRKLKILLIVGVVFLLSSCAVNKSTKRELNVINQFYAAYNEKDFNKLNLIISDKIQLIELNNKVLGSKAAFIDLVECGEVFNSSNSQLSLKESNGKFEATEYEDSDRIQFLYGEPMKARILFTIDNNLISKIEVSYIDFDIEKMRTKWSTFMAWVEVNHPELMKNIKELNKEGALAFKKGMELYKNKN